MVGDGQDPCQHRAAFGPVGRRRAPHLQQHLLGDLLGMRRTAQRPQRRPVHGAAHRAEEQLEGGVVTPRRSRQEVVQLPGLRPGRPGVEGGVLSYLR